MDLFEFMILRAERLSADFPVRSGGPDEWLEKIGKRRGQLMEMLGLDPARQKSPLKPEVRGVLEREGYRIEKLVYQSMPGLYVRCNLYIPSGAKRAPAVIYVCGHSKTGKVHYQSWGRGFAARGFVCLMIDTIEQNDGRGDHHGTYSGNRLDWISIGYTPAGVEALNAIRGIDYLSTRPEVDPERIGMTGISGGGATTWWTAASDKRIKVAAPCCGTGEISLHLKDYTLDTHCDCMFHHNIHQMPLEEVFALIAPRPLLMACQARDIHYYPWSYNQVHRTLLPIWRAMGAQDKLAMAEDHGPHSYGPKLTAAIYEWFARHLGEGLKGSDEVSGTEESKEDLSCFSGKLPADDISDKVHDLFISQQRPPLPNNPKEWQETRSEMRSWLRNWVFRAWPEDPPRIEPVRKAQFLEDAGETVDRLSFVSEEKINVEMEFHRPRNWDGNPELPIILAPAEIRENGEGRADLLLAPRKTGLCFVEARTIGRLAYLTSARIFMERAGALVGYTPDSMALWDILRAHACLKSLPEGANRRVWVYGAGKAAGLAIYAAVLDDSISGVVLKDPPAGHADGGPFFLGVLRKLDIPQAAGFIAPRPILAIGALPESFSWTRDLYARHAVPIKTFPDHSAAVNYLAQSG